MALVSNIQRYSIHDGKGIRTTVFLKGCPLSCLWCSNPENQSFKNEIMYFENKCVSCFCCVKECPTNAIEISDGKPVYLREKCICCGRCEKVCLNDAVKLAAKEYTPEEVFKICSKDAAFFGKDGGITISGGECLSFRDFCLEFSEICRDNGVNLAFETCGYGDANTLLQYAKNAQTIFFDIKHWDCKKHKQMTGVGNIEILHNFKQLTDVFENTVVRIPVIPSFNDSEEDMQKIADLISKNVGKKGIKNIELLPFHNFGLLKYTAINRGNIYENESNMTKDSLDKYQSIFEKK